jgi:hypothetical protein
MNVPSVDQNGTRRASKKDSRGVRNFGRTIMGIAAIPFALGAYGVTMGYLTLQWPRADATVLASGTRIFTTDTTRGGRSVRDERTVVDIAYRYSVAGKDYVGEEIEPYTFGMQNSALAKKHKQRYPAGQVARAAYNAEDPAIAYLEPGPSATAMMFLGIGSVMGLCGLWMQSWAKKGIGRMAT